MGSETTARARDLVERGYRLQLDDSIDEAKHCYMESIALDPSALAHTFLGWALSVEGRIDEAIEECEKAIALDPDLGNPWGDIGAYLMEKGEERTARRYLDRALAAKRHERHHYAHQNLGRLYARQGLLGSALLELRRALALEPRNRHARRAVREIQRRFN